MHTVNKCMHAFLAMTAAAAAAATVATTTGTYISHSTFALSLPLHSSLRSVMSIRILILNLRVCYSYISINAFGNYFKRNLN